MKELLLKNWRIIVSLSLLVLLCGAWTQAQQTPASMIILYRAKPETRAPFRSYMEHAGAARFAKWKHDGVFADCHLLFSSFAATDSPDLFVILDFAQFADLARWKAIEATMPGGLAPEGLTLAAPESMAIADTLATHATRTTSEGKPVYLVLQYDVLTEAPRYAKYVQGYAAPQFEGWRAAGILNSYTAYANENPAGAPWGGLLVLEYKDYAALAAREDVKTKVRLELAKSNAAWKAWSDDKSAIRKEKRAIVAEAIALP